MAENIGISEVKIGGIDYQVQYLEELRDDQDKKLYGRIDYERTELQLVTHMPQVQMNTLIHEVLHGILERAGITEHDEKQIEVLGNGLMQVLADNPQLRKWFERT